MLEIDFTTVKIFLGTRQVFLEWHPWRAGCGFSRLRAMVCNQEEHMGRHACGPAFNDDTSTGKETR